MPRFPRCGRLSILRRHPPCRATRGAALSARGHQRSDRTAFRRTQSSARSPTSTSARALIAERRPDVPALLKRRRTIYHDFYGDQSQAYLERAENAVLLVARAPRRAPRQLRQRLPRVPQRGPRARDPRPPPRARAAPDRRAGAARAATGSRCRCSRPATTCASARPSSSRTRSATTRRRRSPRPTASSRSRGFDEKADHELFVALEIMIAGSTFDARPSPPADLQRRRSRSRPAGRSRRCSPMSSTPSSRAGARTRCSARGRARADRVRPRHRQRRRALHRPRELRRAARRRARDALRPRARRRRLGPAGAGVPRPTGQERYFFDLHRFCSELGKQVFARREGGERARACARSPPR